MKLAVKMIPICLAAFLSSTTLSPGIEHPVHKVLILHSYHHGLQWTDDIMTGIDSVFKKSDSKIQMFVEYMDTKRHDPEDFSPLLYEMYKKRYGNEQIALIIVSDNNGLEFLLRYRDRLFPGVPVVFCGINNFSDAMITGHTGITGVAEKMSIKETISLALRLNPEINQIAVVNDTTPTGIQNQKRLEREIEELRDSIDFVNFADPTIKELQEKLHALPANSAVLLFTFHRDREGRRLEIEEFVPAVSRSSSVPTYSMWKHYIGYGIVGGVVLDGVVQGSHAAEIALNILSGESAERIPVIEKSPNVVMLDYSQLERFSIDASLIPAGSVLINKPPSFYDDHKDNVWGLTGGIVSFCILVLIAFRLRGQKKIELINVQLTKEIEERKKSELDVQMETRLREVLLDNLPCIAMILKKGTREIVASNGVARKLGAVPGKTCYETCAQGSVPCSFCRAPDMWTTNEPVHGEVEHLGKWYEGYWMPFSDKLYVHYIFDITERKLAEVELKKSNELIGSIKDAQSIFISNRDHGLIFEHLLDTLVSMSESEYGFLDEVVRDGGGRWYKRSLALSNIAWDEDSLKLYEELKKSNFEFHNLNNLAGEPVKSGTLVITNDPLHDTRSGGLPDGHPLINSYMGIPLFFGKDLVGVAGVANRKGGYTEDVAAALEPFVTTCASIISAVRSEKSEQEHLNQIEASLAEKEVLLREVHHRVKNNFQIINSLLHLQAESIHEHQMRDIFVDIENRIRSMSMVHELLYSEGDLSRIDITGYINALIQGLYRSYRITTDKVKVRSEIEGVKMGIDAAVPFGLVVNELVSNAMKHAFPGAVKGTIMISFRSTDGGKGYELVVRDDGVGLPRDLDIRKTGSLGLRLVVNIIEKQIGGEVNVSCDRGTEFTIRFSAVREREMKNVGSKQ